MPEGVVNVRSSYRAMWVIAVVLLFVGPVAFADEAWVTALYQPVPGGYRYYLTVYNNVEPQENDYVWALDARLAPAWDLQCPPNWDSSEILYWQVHWATHEAASGAWWKGIPPGQSLSGFNVTTPSLVSSFECRLHWYNGSYGGGVITYAYPELIPEPSSFLALVTCLAVAPLWLGKRRGK